MRNKKANGWIESTACLTYKNWKEPIFTSLNEVKKIMPSIVPQMLIITNIYGQFLISKKSLNITYIGELPCGWLP